MEEVFKDPVQLSQGIDLKELISSKTNFHLDLDFKTKKNGPNFDGTNIMLSDSEGDDDSDNEDVFKVLEERTNKMLLSSPEYHSFEALAAQMVECRCVGVPSGAVRILVLEEGNGPLVPPDAVVTIHYAAYWEKTTIPFDSTVTIGDGSPQRLRLGVGKFLPGVEVALTNIKGPTARFLALLQPVVMWGERGVLPRIPPKPALFVVVLENVGELAVAATFNNLPQEEQMKFETTKRTVTSIQNTAKDLFARKRYSKAIKQYQQAISVISLSRPQTKDEESEIKDLKIKIYLNLAVCYYKLEKPKYTLLMCKNIDNIIDMETNCKALFYCGRANEMLGKSDEALKYYKKALKLEPKNKEIGTLLADLDSKIKNSAVFEQNMWKKVFKTESQVKETFEVESDFENTVLEMCKDLSSRDEFSKFDLPLGVSNDEVKCIKALAAQFEDLIVEEDGQGKKKKVTIIKKVA